VGVDGQINTATNVTDDDDYYAVSLLAGQTVSVQLFKRDPNATSKLIGPDTLLHAGVFDPDGRLIATDYSNQTITTNTGKQMAAQGRAFQFTADRPGVYRFAVGTNDDTTFSGHSTTNSLDLYQLQIKNVGNLALGGVVADGNVMTDQSSIRFNATTGSQTFVPASSLHGIDVDNGDLGAIVAGVSLFQSGTAMKRLGDSGAVNST